MQAHASAFTSLPRTYASDEVSKVHVSNINGSKAKGVDYDGLSHTTNLNTLHF
jgi:hypothetical protein